MKQKIEDTLIPLGYPVDHLNNEYGEDTYIIYSYWGSPTIHADNEVFQRSYTIQVDIISDGGLEEITDKVNKAMKKSGFMWSFEDEEYIKEKKLNRKIIRFTI